jgi:colanic acid biosynthesis glycosyl transferase WcaI
MHFVLINQYYPPDEAPTGLMLEAVAERLAEAGHRVTVICAAGGYAAGGEKPEPAAGQADGKNHLSRDSEQQLAARSAPCRPTIIRLRASRFGRGSFVGKLADYASFYVQVAWQLAVSCPQPDRLVSLTTPPYLSVLARLFSRLRGADHAHWVMDLYPDVMWAHGIIREKSLLGFVLSWLARWGMGGKRCHLVLTLGPDMEERTARYLTSTTPSAWVPLWGTAGAPPISGTPSPATNVVTPPPLPTAPHSIADAQSAGGASPEPRPLRLMYSGNMGLGHRFGEFLQGALAAGDQFEWHFNGDGKRRREIADFKEIHPDAPVTLAGYVPRERLASHLASADVHLASLEPGWDGTMVPSKLQGIFAIGRPVIFVGSETSSMARWIHESGGGWVIPPNDGEALLAALREARHEPVRSARGRAALQFATGHFERGKNSARIAQLLSTPPA